MKGGSKNRVFDPSCSGPNHIFRSVVRVKSKIPAKRMIERRVEKATGGGEGRWEGSDVGKIR